MPKSKVENIQHAWSILCSGVSIDQENNNLSLFNIIEQIRVDKNRLIDIPIKGGGTEPALPIRFETISLWRKIKGDVQVNAEVRVELVDPSGTVRQRAGYSIEFPEKIERVRSRLQWDAIRVTSPGIYTFRVLKKESGQKSFKNAGEIYLRVKIGGEEKHNKEEIK